MHPNLNTTSVGFQALHKRTQISGKVLCKTALHVGTSQSVEVDQVDNPVLLNIHKKPFIPGSTMKGVMRITLESMLRAISPTLACDILDDNRNCIQTEAREKWQEHGMVEEYILQNSCVTCRLFGSPWLASKVKIADLHLAQDHAILESRTGVAIDRDKETSAEKQLYDFEVVSPGTIFQLDLVIDNPEDYELGLLMATIRQFQQHHVFLGGIASRGLGRVEIVVEQISTITAQDMLLHTPGVTIIGDAIPIQLKKYHTALADWMTNLRNTK